MFCPECGNESDEEARFCQDCGTSLRGGYCYKCGAELKRGDKFCILCGTPLARKELNIVNKRANTIYGPWIRGISVIFGSIALLGIPTGWQWAFESGKASVFFSEFAALAIGICLFLLGLFPEATCQRFRIDTYDKYKVIVIILIVIQLFIFAIEPPPPGGWWGYDLWQKSQQEPIMLRIKL